jgi:hypothetical protein
VIKAIKAISRRDCHGNMIKVISPRGSMAR